MDRTRAYFAPLRSAALPVWALACAFPALALAQDAGAGRAPATGGGAAPASTPGADTGGGAGWLWIIAALVVLAIVWWAMSTRRRGTSTR